MRAPIRIKASFDEFNRDLAMSYEGVPIEFTRSSRGVSDRSHGRLSGSSVVAVFVGDTRSPSSQIGVW